MARKKKEETVDIVEEVKEEAEEQPEEKVQEELIKEPEPVKEKPVVQTQEQQKHAVNISGAVKQYTKPDPRNVYCVGYIKEGNYVVDEEIQTLNGKFLKLSNGLYVLAASGNITYIR